ncbi:MAG: hypothetical protein IPP06_05455 [Saprospiraceae bacterium]|nr:hypothetical protein [Candidatus Vicinibacter affinis]
MGLGGDSARYFKEEALKTINRVSDNLGATFSPLISFGKVSRQNRSFQLYYAPQFEFIWRRTKVTTNYSNNVVVDSSFILQNTPIIGTLTISPHDETRTLNVYDVYLGFVGLFLRHENNHISIRMQGSVGLNLSYTSNFEKNESNPELLPFSRSSNFFVFLRAWITEPISGITFGAEVSNTYGKSDRFQPYYNVTLSKAINLNAIGAIFKPVISR